MVTRRDLRLAVVLIALLIVPKHLQAAFTLTVNPASVDLGTPSAGSTTPVSVNNAASLKASGTGTFTISASISYGSTPPAYTGTQNWLTVSLQSTSITAGGSSVSINLTGNPTGLQAGTYTATVTFTAGGSSAKLTVTIEPQGVDFAAFLQGSLSSIQAGQKSKVGTISVNVTTSTGSASSQEIQATEHTDNGGTWLSTSADAGVIVNGAGAVAITVDATSLAAGSTHTATIVLGCINGAPCLPTTLQGLSVQVSALPPTLSSLSPNTGAAGAIVTVTLTGTNLTGATSVGAGAGITVSNLNVISAAQITANFAIAANAALGAQNVTVTTPAGTSNAATFTITAPVKFTLSINPTSVALAGGTNPYTLPVAAGSTSPAYVPSAASLTATGSGTFPISMSISYGATPPAYTSTQNWLTVSLQANSITGGGAAVEISLTGNPIGLQAGTYTAIVTFTAGGSSVLLTVTFSLTGVDFVAYLQAPLSSIQAGQKAKVGTISVNVTSATGSTATQQIEATENTNSGGSWLSTSADSAVSVTGTSTVAVTVDATNLAAGSSYAASITLQCVNGGACLPSTLQGLSVQITGPMPVINSVSPNSGAAGTTVTVTLNGNNLTGATGIGVGAGITVNNLNVISASQITADFVIAANAVPGAEGVTVTTPAGVSNAGIFTVTASPTPPSTQTWVIPHIAAGSSFVTDFYVVNTGSATAHFSIAFRGDDGTPITLPFTGATGPLSTLTDTVPPNGLKFYEAGVSSEPNLVSGSGLVTSDPTITIQALFRRQISDVYYEAAVPASAGGNQFAIPFDATTFAGNGAQIYTGFALANMDNANAANVTCAALDNQGNAIPNAVPIPSLDPNGHWADYLFPLLSNTRGSINCTANTTVGPLAIRALGTDALSTLPIVSSSAAAANGIVPHIAAGSYFVTDFYVLNSGNSSAQFSINFHDDNGAALSLPFTGMGSLATLTDTIPANGLKFYEAGTSDNSALLTGSGVITASSAVTIQTLFRRQVSNVYYEATVPTSAGNYEFLVPFDATTFAANGAQIYTGFAIANMDGVNTATVTCTARNAQGTVIPSAVQVPPLLPYGHYANYLFPALNGLQGTIDCSSNTKLGVVAIRALGVNAISTLPVIGVR